MCPRALGGTAEREQGNESYESGAGLQRWGEARSRSGSGLARWRRTHQNTPLDERVGARQGDHAARVDAVVDAAEPEQAQSHARSGSGSGSGSRRWRRHSKRWARSRASARAFPTAQPRPPHRAAGKGSYCQRSPLPGRSFTTKPAGGGCEARRGPARAHILRQVYLRMISSMISRSQITAVQISYLSIR